MINESEPHDDPVGFLLCLPSLLGRRGVADARDLSVDWFEVRAVIHRGNRSGGLGDRHNADPSGGRHYGDLVAPRLFQLGGLMLRPEKTHVYCIGVGQTW